MIEWRKLTLPSMPNDLDPRPGRQNVNVSTVLCIISIEIYNVYAVLLGQVSFEVFQITTMKDDDFICMFYLNLILYQFSDEAAIFNDLIAFLCWHPNQNQPHIYYYGILLLLFM